MKYIGSWKAVLELDSRRQITVGSPEMLSDAISRAADLRIYTEFLHNEHIDTASSSSERIREVAEFGVTCLLDDHWSAGIMSLRQPIELPTGFGARPSMSFFLYNQDGTQGIARPFLDGRPSRGVPGASSATSPPDMPKYKISDSWDAETNAPSQNFVYDFDIFRYCTSDTWQMALHHAKDGAVLSGSLDELISAFSSGCAVKMGITGLCDDLCAPHETAVKNEIFVQGGSAYYYTEQRLFMIGSHPVIRIRPSIPLRYTTKGWDFGWLMVRSDGRVVYRRCDPYSLSFTDRISHHEVRWFVR